jgi:hypothetical protein
MADKARKERRERERVGIGGILTQNRGGLHEDLTGCCFAAFAAFLRVLCGSSVLLGHARYQTLYRKERKESRKERKECAIMIARTTPQLIASFFCISSNESPLVSG